MISTRSSVPGADLLAGFADPVHGAQTAFRSLMTALSEPGREVEIGVAIPAPPGISPAAIATLLTLADFETALWLGPAFASGRIAEHLRFHTGAVVSSNIGSAALALIDVASAGAILGSFATGTDEYPDTSATVIIDVPALTGGLDVVLTGPGVDGIRSIHPAGLDHRFWAAVIANHQLYPRGVDVILTAGTAIIGLPRSTRVTPAAGHAPTSRGG